MEQENIFKVLGTLKEQVKKKCGISNQQVCVLTCVDPTAEEKPFDIPGSWKWVRLGGVASVFGGKRIPAGRRLSAEDTGYKYIRVSDMKNGSVLTDGLLYIDRYEQAWSRLEKFNKRFPDDMKKSILQLAIQGKLVEQRPEEGTAEELYQQIQAEKQRLIKAGTIKKEKPLPEIPEDEKPFDIPESWKWVRLLDIIEEKPSNGYSPKGVDYPTKVRNLTLTATTSGRFNPAAFKYVDVQIDSDSKCWLKRNDLLIQRSNSRELVGTSCIYDGDDCAYIYPDLMMKLRTISCINVHYVDYVLKSPATRAYFMRNVTGTSDSMPKINQNTVVNTLIPLPPLAEQKRIVEKLEELLPLCERLK